MLVVNSLLSRATTSIGTTLSHPALEVVLTSTTRVVASANVGVETGVVSRVAIEATLLQVLALRLVLVESASHIGHVRGRRSRIVLALVAIAAFPGVASRAMAVVELMRSSVLAVVNSKILLRASSSANVTRLGHMRTREGTLSTQGFGVFLLTVEVLTLGADERGWESGGTRCVGIVQVGLASRHTERLCAAVLGEGAAMSSRFGGERVVSDRAGGLFDGLTGSHRVVGDLISLDILILKLQAVQHTLVDLGPEPMGFP